jgi:hypothetical protein
MVFDDPAYADIDVNVIQRAIEAEGLPILRAEGPIYRFILFNVPRELYRIAEPCLVTEHACDRMLWLLHAYLGLKQDQIIKIADAIEKVVTQTRELRRYRANRGGRDLTTELPGV